MATLCQFNENASSFRRLFNIAKVVFVTLCIIGLADILRCRFLWIGERHVDADMAGEFWAQQQDLDLSQHLNTLPKQLPGPADSWAGNEQKAITFPLPRSMKQATIRLKILDSHSQLPPILRLSVDGQVVASTRVPKGLGSDPHLWDAKSLDLPIVKLRIPAEVMRMGPSEAVIRNVEGSWVVFGSMWITRECPDWEEILVGLGCCILLLWMGYRFFRHRTAMAPMWRILLLVAPIIFWLWSLASPTAPLRLDTLPHRTVVLIPEIRKEIALWVAGIVLIILNVLTHLRMVRQQQVHRLHSAPLQMSLLTTLVLACRALLGMAPALSSNLLYFGVPAILAWASAPFCHNFSAHKVHRSNSIRLWALIFIASSIIYTGLGIHFTRTVGAHSGDEGHYMIQARSLYNDGDLDLRNDVAKIAPDASPTELNNLRQIVHISKYSRDGKWYSWHSRGLSLLLAPVVPYGVIGRHCVLGLIAGLGVAGVFLLSMQLGASHRLSIIATLLIGTSTFWAIYASRALPEVLGATLATYAMLATISQAKRPWISMCVCTIAISALPWAHTRFIPLALTAIGCYGLQGLLGGESWPRKVTRLSIFSLCCAIGLGAYQVFQFRLFEGGSSYPVPKLLFSYPVGMWHTLMSDRGILVAFPVFACAIAATLYLLTKRNQRVFALFALLYFLSIFLTSSATHWFTGGSCLPGRFLLVTTPVLVAALAYSLKNSGAGFRSLVCYMGIFSACMLVTELTVLQHLNKSFTNPYLVDAVHPLFLHLIRVLPSTSCNLTTTPWLAPFMIYICALTLLFLPTRNRYVHRGLLAALVIGVFGVSILAKEIHRHRHDPASVAQILAYTDGQDARLFVTGNRDKPLNLFDFSNRFTTDTQIASLVTTRVIPPSQGDDKTRVISLPALPPNDWQRRGYRWASLVRSFRTGKGKRALRLEGNLSGEAHAELVILEGSIIRGQAHFAPGEPIHEILSFQAEGTGDIKILLRLYGGEGQFECHALRFSAYTDTLLQKANLTLM